jgi:hypothetical protein
VRGRLLRIRKLVEFDDEVRLYDSDTFRLLASPRAECALCFAAHEGDETLADLIELDSRGEGSPAPNANGP